MSLITKLLLTIVALGTIFIGLADLLDHQTQRDRREVLFTAAGLDQDESRLGRVLARDPDAIDANDRLALALVAQLLDPSSRRLAATPAELQQRLAAQVEQLDVAEQLARESLRQRPSSWRALTVIGAVTYLRRSIGRDDLLLRQHRDWEAPLESARALAPHRAEPTRFLTMAYLEIWPMLSEAKQQLTRQMLAASLDDPDVYRVTINPWLQVSGLSLEALDLLPEKSWVYADLRVRLTARGQPRLALEASRRYREQLLALGEQQLTLAKSASGRGDHIGARKILGNLINLLPLDVNLAPLAESVFRAMPAGPIPRFAATPFVAWMNFNSDQCLTSHCQFEKDIVERLLHVMPEGVARLRAQLAKGDLAGATASEAELAEPCSREAVPYWLQKSMLELENGNVSGARTSLLNCAAAPRTMHSLLYERLFEAVRPGNSATKAMATFEHTPGVHIGEPHPGSGSIELALPAGEYELDLLPLAAQGANSGASLIELLLDGALIGTVAIDSSSEVQELRVSATGRPQSLKLRRVAGPIRILRILEARPVS